MTTTARGVPCDLKIYDIDIIKRSHDPASELIGSKRYGFNDMRTIEKMCVLFTRFSFLQHINIHPPTAYIDDQR